MNSHAARLPFFGGGGVTTFLVPVDTTITPVAHPAGRAFRVDGVGVVVLAVGGPPVAGIDLVAGRATAGLREGVVLVG